MKALIDYDGAPVFGIALVDGGAIHEGMLIEGPQGWGEFSPRAGCDDRELARWLTSATEGGTVGWPDPLRGRVPVAVAVPAVSPSRARELTTRSGCRAADVTVATGPESLADDVARVEAVRHALGPDGAIRLWAGGRWTADAAVGAIPVLATAAGGLTYVGQPCRTVAELVAVRRSVEVRIAVDLASSDADGSIASSLADAADVVILRCGPLGGVRRALRLAELSGLPCVVASGGETSIGLASGLALAGALPELPFACGLATRAMLAGDVVAHQRSLTPVDGHLPVASSAAAPEWSLLQRHSLTDPNRIAWWRARLKAISQAW